MSSCLLSRLVWSGHRAALAIIWWTLWRLCLGKQLDNWCICGCFSCLFGQAPILNVFASNWSTCICIAHAGEEREKGRTSNRVAPNWPEPELPCSVLPCVVLSCVTGTAFYVVHVIPRSCFKCPIEKFAPNNVQTAQNANSNVFCVLQQFRRATVLAVFHVSQKISIELLSVC